MEATSPYYVVRRCDGRATDVSDELVKAVKTLMGEVNSNTFSSFVEVEYDIRTSNGSSGTA